MIPPAQSSTQSPAPAPTTSPASREDYSLLSRAQIIAGAGRYLPRTEEGIPAGFYRADLVPYELPPSQAALPSSTEAAFTPLNHQEGFPALPDGRPFWHKLDYESPGAFAAFEVYVNAANSGPRYLAALLHSPELQRLYGDALSLDLLQEMHVLYYWKDRARAFDLFQEAAYRHLRTRRAQKMEDYHFLQSEALLQKVFQALSTEDTFEVMRHEPKLLLEAMDKLIKVQRVSAGLPTTAPGSSVKGSEEVPTSFEMVMRQVTQKNVDPSTNSNSATVDERGRIVPTTDNLLRGALNDPDSARLLQEVIIRVSRNAGATKKPRWATDPDSPDPDANEEGPGDED